MISTKNIQKLIDDGQTETALDQINGRIKNKPTPELHVLRIKALSRLQLEDVPVLQTSLDWLMTHAPVHLTEAQTSLQEVIQQRLSQIPGLEQKSESSSIDALTVVQELIPLAEYFPMIHLTCGLILMHKARGGGSSSEKKSPLEILEEILAGAENERTPKGPRRRPRSEEKQIESYQQARHHLEQARRLFPKDDTRYGSTLEALGQVCEALEDSVGAWKAYHEAESYGYDFRNKLILLGKTLKEAAQQRLLLHIDTLLRAGDLDQAAVLLETCSPTKNDDFRVRAADLAFLRGTLEEAAAYYNDLLE